MQEPINIQHRLFPLLFLPSRIYSAIMRYRRSAYERGQLESYRPECPCVSIGNIRWGGTGKTPLTHWLTRWMIKQGKCPVVLTRGYKASPPSPPYLVNEDSTPEQAGDEPLMLARDCPEARVVVDPKRMRAAIWAQKELTPDVFILDDGFQHLAVQRHVNIVLLRPADLTQDWDRVFPAGPWREGESALTRASVFLIKCPPDVFMSLEPLIGKLLKRYKVPVFNFSIRPRGLKRLDRPEAAPDFKGEPYLLISGVSEPQQVQQTAQTLLGSPPAHQLRFDDHYSYTEQDWNDIRETADLKNIRHIVCTTKDAVKLAQFDPRGLWTFDNSLSFGEAFYTREAFPDWWENMWELL